MIKDGSGATSWSLSPPVHLWQPVAALSRAEAGSAALRCLGEIRRVERHSVLTGSRDVNKGGSVKVGAHAREPGLCLTPVTSDVRRPFLPRLFCTRGVWELEIGSRRPLDTHADRDMHLTAAPGRISVRVHFPPPLFLMVFFTSRPHRGVAAKETEEQIKE